MKNAILVTIDCLRPDHLGCYGYNKATSPNIDHLAKKGVIFLNAFANSSWTPASFPSIFTSTYPLMYGGYKGIHDRTTLAEVLARKGYSTGGFHSNAFLSSHYGYNKGFGTFYEAPVKSVKGAGRLKRKIRNLASRNEALRKFLIKFHDLAFPNKYNISIPTAEELNKKVFSWLSENHNRKFFLWIHYMDVHNPHVPPPGFSLNVSKGGFRRITEKARKIRHRQAKPELLTKSERKTLIEIYDAEIRFVDHHLGLFFEKLESLGLSDNTFIIVTADHGTALLEHGDLDHPPELYDEVVHVPLIMCHPTLEQNSVKIKEMVSLLDVSPTILDILTGEKEVDFIGNSLLPLLEGRKEEGKRVIGEVANPLEKLEVDLRRRKTYVRTRKWKFISDEERRTRELFKIDVDEGEERNLAEKRPEVAEEFLSVVKEHQELERKINKMRVMKRVKERIKKLKSVRKYRILKDFSV